MELDPTLEELYEQARVAAAAAYVPYSKFNVGAALRAPDGTVFTGCNVENASFGLTICAERNAASTAVATGVRAFDAVAVHVDGPDGMPCGMCRQFLSEFGLDMTVVYRSGGELRVRPLRELLPDAFEPSSLAHA